MCATLDRLNLSRAPESVDGCEIPTAAQDDCDSEDRWREQRAPSTHCASVPSKNARIVRQFTP